MAKKEKVVIVIQARMSSSRLPGKVMLPVLEKSLLYRMVERLQMVQHKVKLVIATSESPVDDIIVEEAAAMGIACYRGNLFNVLDRHYKAALEHKADVVIKIPSDCPLIDPRIVDQVLDFYFKSKGRYDYVSNLHPATFPDGNDVEIMTMDCLTAAWENAFLALELEHTTPYIWERPQEFRIGNVTCADGDFSMSHRFTIDYQQDYEFIASVFAELYPVKPDFSCQDIMDLLAEKPELYKINASYAGVNWYRHHLGQLKTVGIEQTRQPQLEQTA